MVELLGVFALVAVLLVAKICSYYLYVFSMWVMRCLLTRPEGSSRLDGERLQERSKERPSLAFWAYMKKGAILFATLCILSIFLVSFGYWMLLAILNARVHPDSTNRTTAIILWLTTSIGFSAVPIHTLITRTRWYRKLERCEEGAYESTLAQLHPKLSRIISEDVALYQSFDREGGRKWLRKVVAFAAVVFAAAIVVALVYTHR